MARGEPRRPPRGRDTGAPPREPRRGPPPAAPTPGWGVFRRAAQSRFAQRRSSRLKERADPRRPGRVTRAETRLVDLELREDRDGICMPGSRSLPVLADEPLA